MRGKAATCGVNRPPASRRTRNGIDGDVRGGAFVQGENRGTVINVTVLCCDGAAGGQLDSAAIADMIARAIESANRGLHTQYGAAAGA